MPIDDLTVPVRSAAGLGDAEMQRVVAGLGQLLIGGDGEEHVGRLHADLELVEVVVLAGCVAWSSALSTIASGQGSPYFSSRSRLERAGIDADAHRAAVVRGRLDDLAHPLGAADIAGIDAQAGGARLGRLDGALVVEMDVGDDRHLRRLRTIVVQRRGRFLVGAGDADDVDAGLLQRADLRRWSPSASAVSVLVIDLHRDRRVAADRHRADHDLPATCGAWMSR